MTWFLVNTGTLYLHLFVWTSVERDEKVELLPQVGKDWGRETSYCDLAPQKEASLCLVCCRASNSIY
jgi:hypothetical protein